MQISSQIQGLCDAEPFRRLQAAQSLFDEGVKRISRWLSDLENDEELRTLIVRENFGRPDHGGAFPARLTVGIGVSPQTFARIRVGNGSPALAAAPSDQDVLEFELEFKSDSSSVVRLDILTTHAPAGNGAIARFLKKFGEDIQQVEIDVSNVDRATHILRTRFKAEPIYPATRPGANGTLVNFFLITTLNGTKVLVELVEQPKL